MDEKKYKLDDALGLVVEHGQQSWESARMKGCAACECFDCAFRCSSCNRSTNYYPEMVCTKEAAFVYRIIVTRCHLKEKRNPHEKRRKR